MIDDWIEKIVDSNKVMETLHEDIHWLKDQVQEWILEEERHYIDACLDIFEDEEWENLLLAKVVVENFNKIFEEASSDEDIHQAFRIEEGLLEWDTKLGNFTDTWIEVDNYRQKVKDKYDASHLLGAEKITNIMEKFKGKHPNIALGWRRTKPRC